MSVKNEKFLISTNGFSDIIDITMKVNEAVRNSVQYDGVKNAVIHIFCPASTASVTTMEYEPGLVKDIPEALDRLIPDIDYNHNKTWHDGNGHSHIKASIIGNSVTVPYVNGEIVLGEWQQIVLIDFDNKPRTRTIIVQTTY